MELCSFPRCKRLSDFTYIKRDICEVHWEQLCGADSKTENRLLKKIGLTRNCDGLVVPITKKEKCHE